MYYYFESRSLMIDNEQKQYFKIPCQKDFFSQKHGPFWLSRRPLAKFRSDMLQTGL